MCFHILEKHSLWRHDFESCCRQQLSWIKLNSKLLIIYIYCWRRKPPVRLNINKIENKKNLSLANFAPLYYKHTYIILSKRSISSVFDYYGKYLLQCNFLKEFFTGVVSHRLPLELVVRLIFLTKMKIVSG